MKYIISQKIDIDAPASFIFMVLTNLEKWPDWTGSVKKITRISGDSFSTGSRYRVQQPGLLPAVWTVTSIREKSSFSWEQKKTGLRLTAHHQIVPISSGGVTVHLSMVYEGILAGLVYYLTAALTRRYLDLELHGIRHECERDVQEQVAIHKPG